jgi:hypothetical protein
MKPCMPLQNDCNRPVIDVGIVGTVVCRERKRWRHSVGSLRCISGVIVGCNTMLNGRIPTPRVTRERPSVPRNTRGCCH